MADFLLSSGYTVTIDSDGLSRITRNGHTVATRGTRLLDARHWLGQIPYVTQGDAIPLVSKVAQPLSPSETVVEHQYAKGALQAVVTWTFTVTGDDVAIRAVVTNTGTIVMPCVALASTVFPIDNWSSLPWSKFYHLSYGSAQLSQTAETTADGRDGSDYWYPSALTKTAASWMTVTAGGGEPLNVACWPTQPPDLPFITVMGSMYQVGQYFAHFFQRDLGPGDRRTVGVVLRFSQSDNWQELLGGYKAMVRTYMPALLFTPDARPLGQFASIDATHIRPNNPYGYNDSNGSSIWRRFDTAAGAAAFGEKVIPGMCAGGFQGMICWQPQGIHPRGVMYRPDFNVFPPETRAQTHILCDPFAATDLGIGYLMRPHGTITSSATWGTDRQTTTSTHPSGLADLASRIADMTALGFAGPVYLDSFVQTPQDQIILQAIRRKLGFTRQSYIEGATVASAPYSGTFTTISYTAGAFKIFADPVVRWIYPDTPITAQVNNLPPGGYSELYAYMLANQITPLVADYLIPTHASILAPLVAQHIDANHQWRSF